ncbi:putative acyl-CoA desaturase [Helianthus anomalus]
MKSGYPNITHTAILITMHACMQGVRTKWVYHMTFLVNSACHIWGNRAWNTEDMSRNNWWVAMVTFEDGWHNNHHAFEYSARYDWER